MSASLPPRPALDSPPRPLSPSRRFPDDRERRPNRSMASQRFPPRRDDRDYPPPPRRDERDFRRGDGDRAYSGPPRPRPPVDSYIAPADTYVPRDGFRRRDDRPRERYPGPRDLSRERRDGYGGRGRDFRDRTPPGRQVYIPERRRGSSRPPYREPLDYPPRRDFRPGSPRRGDSYISRSSRSPRRRPLSPRPRSRPRSPPRTSSPRQVKLGDHSISTSPPPKSPYNRGHSPRETQWNKPDHQHDRSRSPPSRRLSRERESITSDKDLRRDHDSETEKQLNETRISSLPSPRSAPLTTPHETESSKPDPSPSQSQTRPSTPIKTEIQQDVPIPVESDAMKIDESTQDQGVPKEEPIDGDGDIKMKDRSLSPPRHPRADRFQHSRSAHDRSPPRGPRNPNLNQRGGAHGGNNPNNFSHMNPNPNSNSSSPFNYQQTPRRPRGYPGYAPSAPAPAVQTPPPSQPPIETKKSPTPEPDTSGLLPVIPVYQFPTLYTPDDDPELKVTLTHKIHLSAEYPQLSKSTRRALHELDLATLDLRAAEGRRRVADSQLEKARLGTLGIGGAVVTPTDSDVAREGTYA